MSLRVIPVQQGPDLTGETDLVIENPVQSTLVHNEEGKLTALGIRLTPMQTALLFGLLGNVRQQELANTEPSDD